ncbi:MAG: TOBE domain-containing protein [Propionibacteriaceae bacterium]|nr:TOBE domain-containing protein [Propionibacteriaceae bacterium]
MHATRVNGNAVTLAGAGIALGGRAFHHTITASTDVVVAIRPEDIRVGPGVNSFSVTVEANEYRGSEYAIDASTVTGQLIHLVSKTGCEPGSQITVNVLPERVLVYPVETP